MQRYVNGNPLLGNREVVIYSEAIDPLKVSEEMLKQGFVLVTKEQWKYVNTAEERAGKAEEEVERWQNDALMDAKTKRDNAALQEEVRVMREAMLEIASGNRTAHECINWAKQALKEVSEQTIDSISLKQVLKEASNES